MYTAATQPRYRTVTLPPAKSIFAVTSVSGLITLLHNAPEIFHRIIFIFVLAFVSDTIFGLILAVIHKEWKSRRQRVMSADKMVGYMVGLAFGMFLTLLGSAWWPSEIIIGLMIANEMKSLLEIFDDIAQVYDFGKLGEGIHVLAKFLDVPDSTHKRIEMSAVFDSDKDSPSVTAVAIEQTTHSEQGRKGGSTRERSVPVNTGPLP